MTQRSARLRAVGADEKTAAAAKPKTVAQAAKSDDPRELLVAMRDRIAETVTDPNCPPRELGVLTKRLQDIARDLAVLQALAEEQGKQSESDGTSGDAYDPSAV